MRTYCFIAGKLAGFIDSEPTPAMGDEIVFQTTFRNSWLPPNTTVKFRVSEHNPLVIEDGFASVEVSHCEVVFANSADGSSAGA